MQTTEVDYHMDQNFPMNPYLSMVFRPSSIVTMLATAALVVSVSLTPCWYGMLKHIEQRVNSNSQVFLSQTRYKIEDSANLLLTMNSSSVNLARLLSSDLSTNYYNSFSEIETKVVPVMFQAFKTIPYLTEISYVGEGGLFFSYYTDDHDRVLAMYSNSSSFNLGASKEATIYYIQPVNRDTGMLYGEAITSKVGPSLNKNWNEKRMDSSDGYNASIGRMRSNGGDLLFISSVRIMTRGTTVSLGFPAKSMTDLITRIVGQGPNLLMCLATKDGTVLVQGIQDTHMVFSNDMVSFKPLKPINGDPQTNFAVNVSCKDEAVPSVSNILGTQYLLHCSSIDIMGVESVYVLAVPQNNELVSFVHNSRKEGSKLMILAMTMIIFSISSFLILNGKATMREMHLCASLIKQMETAQEAERKFKNKSLALASASHDVRASLAALTGLIEMSYDEVDHASELNTNLKQMESCTKDLLGLLNSIIDTSKIEAGKMQLEEEEFDLSQLLEDVVDLYHPVAMKKGVDLILDPCDGSVLRYSSVKGDRGKLKQVLVNLLSNAVKFTDEGHITVRAWGEKPSFQNSITASKPYSSFMEHLSCLFCKENEENEDLEAADLIQQDVNCMDFVFEVDDTGRGIPKDKHKSVFENYVQVKETALGQVGTGLGLGIVQSLVRLMRGDIGIVDKDMGDKGTCFRFNVLLTVSDQSVMSGSTIEGIEEHQFHGLIQTTRPSSMLDASCVVLLIQYEERRRTLQKFIMETLGIEVKVVNKWEHLSSTLENICPDLSAAEGINAKGFVLIVIDANAGPFAELCSMVSKFRRGLRSECKVVWLNKPLKRSVNLKAPHKDMFDPDDIVISKPFHGTRLFQVIKLLPEYRQTNSSRAREKRESDGTPFQNVEQFKKESSEDQSHNRYRAGDSSVQHEIQECDDSSLDKNVRAKRFLIVDDTPLYRKITMRVLRSLGVNAEQCENGEQAVKLVEEGLTRAFPNLPYDYILMDCRMPVMDGYEATRRIREMEKEYGVHIPIIGLSGYASEEDTRKSIDAGMDIHLDRPLEKDQLIEAINRYIHSRE